MAQANNNNNNDNQNNNNVNPPPDNQNGNENPPALGEGVPRGLLPYRLEEYTYHGARNNICFELWRGDIAFSTAHVAVLAANANLQIGGGTAGDIAARSLSMLRFVRTEVYENHGNPFPPGHISRQPIVQRVGENLRVNEVWHTVCPRFFTDD